MSLVVIALAATTIGASAQHVVLSGVVPQGDPIAAVDTEYGRALRGTIVQVLSANTEASCRQSRGLDNESLARRVRDIFILHGTMSNGFEGRVIDSYAFATAFVQGGGAEALNEWSRLLVQPLIRQLAATQAPARNNDLSYLIIENIYRFALLRRAPRPIVFGLEPERPDLKEILERDKAATAKAVDAFVQSNPDASIKRYLQFSDLRQSAFKEAFKTGNFGVWGIFELYPGIADRLRSLCITISDQYP
jgi:hypothetical protein